MPLNRVWFSRSWILQFHYLGWPSWTGCLFEVWRLVISGLHVWYQQFLSFSKKYVYNCMTLVLKITWFCVRNKRKQGHEIWFLLLNMNDFCLKQGQGLKTLKAQSSTQTSQVPSPPSLDLIIYTHPHSSWVFSAHKWTMWEMIFSPQWSLTSCILEKNKY